MNRFSLFRLILQLKRILSEVKDHWISLPRIVCASGMAAPEGSSGKCWNGENVNGYECSLLRIILSCNSALSVEHILPRNVLTFVLFDFVLVSEAS